MDFEKVILDGCDLRMLPPQRARQLLTWAYELLEFRVGQAIGKRLDTRQLDDFEAILSTDDDGAAYEWLIENLPDYADIVARETEQLKLEISQRRPLLIAAAI
jgi:hypothetical protein